MRDNTGSPRQQGLPSAAAGGASSPAPPQPLQGPPQLPPQMFTTAAQLLDLTDSELVPFSTCLNLLCFGPWELCVHGRGGFV